MAHVGICGTHDKIRKIVFCGDYPEFSGFNIGNIKKIVNHAKYGHAGFIDPFLVIPDIRGQILYSTAEL